MNILVDTKSLHELIDRCLELEKQCTAFQVRNTEYLEENRKLKAEAEERTRIIKNYAGGIATLAFENAAWEDRCKVAEEKNTQLEAELEERSTLLRNCAKQAAVSAVKSDKQEPGPQPDPKMDWSNVGPDDFGGSDY